MTSGRFTSAILTAGFFLVNLGCSSSAQLDLSAAQVLLTIADEMRATVEEYHADLARLDEQRESFAIQAFFTRVASADGDQAKIDQNSAALTAALAKLRADRAVAVERYIIARGNLDLLTETAESLTSHARARLRFGQNLLRLLVNEE